jgi:hypothetical protein
MVGGLSSPPDEVTLTEPLSGGGTGIAIEAGCSGLAAAGFTAKALTVEGAEVLGLVAEDGTGTRIGRREVISWVVKAEAVAAIGEGAGIDDRDLACLTTTVTSGLSTDLGGARGGSASAS